MHFLYLLRDNWVHFYDLGELSDLIIKFVTSHFAFGYLGAVTSSLCYF